MKSILEIQLSFKYKQFVGIIILIGSLRCLKEAKTMDMILGLSVNLNTVPLFSVTYVDGTHWNCLIEYLQHVSFQLLSDPP